MDDLVLGALVLEHQEDGQWLFSDYWVFGEKIGEKQTFRRDLASSRPPWLLWLLETRRLIISWLFWIISDYFSFVHDIFRRDSTLMMYHTRHSNQCLITSTAAWFRGLKFRQNSSLKVFMNTIPFSFSSFKWSPWHISPSLTSKGLGTESLFLLDRSDWSSHTNGRAFQVSRQIVHSVRAAVLRRATGFSVVPIQALCFRLPKRLTLTALLWCYFYTLTSLSLGNIVRITQSTVSASCTWFKLRYLECFW